MGAIAWRWGSACLAGLGLILTLSRAGIAAGFTSLDRSCAAGARCRREARRGRGGGIRGAGDRDAGRLRGALAADDASGEFNAPNGLATRAQLWAAAFELWKRSPWLGIGAGNFELHLQSVGLEGVRTHPNSAYMQALVEGGIPLLAAVLWTAFASVWVFARSGVRTRAHRRGDRGVGRIRPAPSLR